MRLLLDAIHELADPDLGPASQSELSGKLAAFTQNARERRDKLRIQLAMAEKFVEQLEAMISDHRPVKDVDGR